MIGGCAVILAFAVDGVWGEPPNPVHPVAWMGHAIGWGRDWSLRTSRVGQLVRGALMALVIPSAAAFLAFAVLRVVGPSPWVVLAVTAVLLKPMFAVRALRDAAFAVGAALDEGDVAGARRALSSLCSRDASALDAPALVAATVESVAENASDSIVAPLFFFALFGLPGAVFYRAVNTMDAMVGYRGRFEWAGKAAARLDDALNFVPARVTAALLLAAGVLTGADGRRGARVLRRDGGRTESPNAGRPMAAMAGLLGVRLEKAGCYALGDATEPLTPSHVKRAWRIVSAAACLAVALTAALAFAFQGGVHV